MENNYSTTFENETNDPSLACIEAILTFSRLVQSFEYNDIRFKLHLN